MVELLIKKYEALGIKIWLDKETKELHFKAPSGTMTPERISELKLNKQELIKYFIGNENIADSIDLETRKIRESINSTQGPVPEGLLHDGFLSNVTQNADKNAVYSRGKYYTYQELSYYVASVQEYLLGEIKVRYGGIVAIAVGKGVWQVASVLGTLVSGATYLPIDIEQPVERIEKILDAARVQCVLTCDEEKELEQKYQCIRVDKLKVKEGEIQKLSISPDQAAYVIFTSGSTGIPKGVVISHRAALNTIDDINQKFSISHADKVLALANLAFDLSVYDLFGMLNAGGTIVFPDAERKKNPKHWAELIEKEKVTIWNSVPAQMQMLVENVEVINESLRLVLLSGDWIPVNLPDKIWDKMPDTKIISLGGATEAAIWSIYYPIHEVNPDMRSIPYGTPLKNQQFYILDENLKECPDEKNGGIYIAGLGLAEGYLNDPELTKEKFFFHPALKKRLYFTGDIGYYRKDGIIEFIGRVDNQVKVNGHRVELSEIDNILQGNKDVKQAVSLLATTENKSNRIITFVVPSNDSRIGTDIEEREIEQIWKENTQEINRDLFENWVEAANLFSLSGMLQILKNNGIFIQDSDQCSLEEMKKQLRIAENHFKLFDEWINSLENEGYIIYDKKANKYKSKNKSFDYFESEKKLEEAQKAIDFGTEFYEYFKESNNQLLKLLTGQLKALDLLFPKGDINRAIGFYQNHLCSRFLNNTLVELLKKIISNYNSKEKKCLKILEVGAGVGGTSNYLIPGLKFYNIEYYYTDVSSYFINEAKKRYKEYDFVKYGLFDINLPYWEQGYSSMEFDIVLGNNVFHNAKDCLKCMKEIKELIVPGGYLAVLDTIKDPYYMQTSVRFNEGLSNFEDFRKNTKSPFLKREEWKNIFEEIESEVIAEYPKSKDKLEEAGLAMFLLNVNLGQKQINRDEVKRYLESKMPDYMIPTYIEIIPEIPLTNNGKVDRKKLKERADKSSHLSKMRLSSTMNDTEKQIYEIWREVLQTDYLDKKDNFFEVGGDSLLIAQLVTKMKNELQLFKIYSWDELLRITMQNPTIEELSKVSKEKEKRK